MENMSYTLGQVRGFDKDAAIESRTVEFVISDSTRDRYGTVVNVRGWDLEPFGKNPIVGYQHHLYGSDLCSGPNPDDVIGTGRAWVEGDQLIGSITFEPADINPLAEKLFRKVLHGSLRATSVGFTPIGQGRWGEGDEARGGANATYYFEGQQLLEFSLVNLPANPNALKRSLRDQTAHALMYVRRMTGLPFADIERMTMRDVLEALEGHKEAEMAAKGTEMAAELAEVEETAVPNPGPSTEDIRASLRLVMDGGLEGRIRKAMRGALN